MDKPFETKKNARNEEIILATDISLLHAANSFLTPSQELKDPRAEYNFEVVTSAFCSGAKLLFPLPKTHLGTGVQLFTLWSKHASPVESLEITNENLKPIIQDVIPGFLQYAEDEAADIAEWIACHMHPVCVRSYLSRTTGEQEILVSQIGVNFLEKNQLPKLLSELERLEHDRLLNKPPEYEEIVQRHFRSSKHFYICYAFSYYLRGWSYAFGITEKYSNAIYRPFWLRSSILRHIAQYSDIKIKQQEIKLFPWGVILRAVFDPKKPLLNRDIKKVQEVLLALRENAGNFNIEVEKLGGIQILNTCPSNPGSAPPSEIEELVLETLQKSGIVPRFRQSSKAKNFLSWLGNVIRRKWGDILPEFIKDPPEVFSQNKFLRKYRLKDQLQFKRDTIWDKFEDPQIREALHQWSRQIVLANSKIEFLPASFFQI